MTLSHPRPMSQDAEQRLDIIFVEGYTAQTIIGIHAGEEDQPQPVRIDLSAGLPRARACNSDSIGDTIDYSVVHSRLSHLLRNHSFKLLEALAEEIAAILVREFGAVWTRVRVAKPGKLTGVQAVGVEIERDASDFAGHSSKRGGEVLSIIGAGHIPQI